MLDSFSFLSFFRDNLFNNIILPFDMEDKQKVDDILNRHEYKRDAIIQILSDIQEILGYLSYNVLAYISDEIHLPLSKIYGIVTFYSFFRFTPQAEVQISICQGTACHVSGAKNLLDQLTNRLKVEVGEKTDDNRFSLESVACLGACSLAPAIVINGHTYGRLDKKNLDKILDDLGAKK